MTVPTDIRVQHLPVQRGHDFPDPRMHRLDETCWCEPEVRGPNLHHRDETGTPVDHSPRAVQGGRKEP